MSKVLKKTDLSIGIILYKEFPRGIKYLILKHRQGHWALCKGHRNPGETKIQTALRELKEETGIKEVTLLRKKTLVTEKYLINGERTEKTVEYFIGKTKAKKVKVDGKEIKSYVWRGYESALKKITYKKTKNSLSEANKIIHKMKEIY